MSEITNGVTSRRHFEKGISPKKQTYRYFVRRKWENKRFGGKKDLKVKTGTAINRFHDS